MSFNSLQYAVFLVLVLATYWSLPKRGQNALLLVASYVFYGWWDWRFCFLIAVSTVIDYVVGLLLHGEQREARRKALFGVSLAANLGLLGFFKYFGFFVESATAALDSIGLAPSTGLLEIILPVGISFYTFQTMSYTFDIYRRRFEPTRDPVLFAAFVAYFPQLVAGPIERASNLLPQLADRRTTPDAEQVQSALWLILLGLFKKVVVADSLARQVDLVFGSPEQHTGLELLVGAWAFSLQIYGDFSGYSDIARGSSRLMGIELMRNFEQPFLSASITEFWRRWHISLSSWLRDYLYVPLGGNRGTPARTMGNLLLTMLLGGLWHGASWVFVIWGALHGLALAFERLTGWGRDAARTGWSRVLHVLVTFQVVSLIFVFFRSRDLASATSYLGRLFDPSTWVTPEPTDLLLLTAVMAVLVFAIDVAQDRTGRHVPVVHLPAPAQGAVAGAAAAALVVFSGAPEVPFIYFQF